MIECDESPRSLVPEAAQIKQRNLLTRVALLGQH
jgi:hypothetical protein